MNIPVGICQCGCGRATNPAQRDSRAYRKGEMQKFCCGHKTHKPILKAYRKGHDGGGKHLHRIRAEHAFGGPLPLLAVVHHADGTKNDDAPLVICENEAYHRLLHRRLRVKQRGGNPNIDKVCGICQIAKAFAEFTIDRGSSDGLYGYCRECVRKKRKAA